MKNKNYCYYLVLLLVIAVTPMSGTTTENFKKGEVISNVTCLSSPAQSYALYLPSNYGPEKNWPILYAFDPAARGSLPVNLYREAAEKYGYIVVCSNNSRNGPTTKIIDAIKTVWSDTHKRFKIDGKRIYTTGFSGGSRVASLFSYVVKKPVRGIIGCGAGLTRSIKPEQIKTSSYCGIVGLSDFNYDEMNLLAQVLKNLGVPFRMFFFDGGHVWPSKEFCTRALEWMEIHAYQTNLLEKNSTIINQIFNKELEIAQKYEKQKDVDFMANQYESIISVFQGLKDTENLKDKLKNLKADKAYRKLLKKKERIKKQEIDFMKKMFSIYMIIEKPSRKVLNLTKIKEDLQISKIKKDLSRKDRYEINFARRKLYTIMDNARVAGERTYRKKNYNRASIFYEIATSASLTPASYLYYNLACSLALDGQKKNALKNLKLAVENGTTNVDMIEKDEDLASIRNTKKYKEIISKLKN